MGSSFLLQRPRVGYKLCFQQPNKCVSQMERWKCSHCQETIVYSFLADSNHLGKTMSVQKSRSCLLLLGLMELTGGKRWRTHPALIVNLTRAWRQLPFKTVFFAQRPLMHDEYWRQLGLFSSVQAALFCPVSPFSLSISTVCFNKGTHKDLMLCGCPLLMDPGFFYDQSLNCFKQYITVACLAYVSCGIYIY